MQQQLLHSIVGHCSRRRRYFTKIRWNVLESCFSATACNAEGKWALLGVERNDTIAQCKKSTQQSWLQSVCCIISFTGLDPKSCSAHTPYIFRIVIRHYQIQKEPQHADTFSSYFCRPQKRNHLSICNKHAKLSHATYCA